MTHLEEHQVALTGVLQACEMASQCQGTLKEGDFLHKEDLSPVTVVDFALQAFLNSLFLQHFPHIKIMGEENGSSLRERKALLEKVSKLLPNFTQDELIQYLDAGTFPGGAKDTFWAIDPIDGTKGFLRGDQFAVGVALIEKGEVVVGVIGCPNLIIQGRKGVIFSAICGQEPMLHFLDDGSKAPMPHLESKEFVYCEPHSSSKTHSHSAASRIAKKISAEATSLQIDSQCKYGLLALGLANIYFRIPTETKRLEKIWDHAAGSLILEASGGVVTDLFGKKLNFGLGNSLKINQGILATHAIDHALAVKAAREVLTLP